ncbi:MAG: sulfurtransferase [Burkholderiales bacterium]
MGEAQARPIGPLVSGDELSRHPGWRVFDCRHDLLKPELGEQQYREGHLPGALFAHLDRDLSALKNGRNGRHPLPDANAFIAWVGAQGLKTADTVVCYDSGSGSMAARLWWMLRWIGHESVAVLDGGFARWLKQGRPFTAEVPVFAPTIYPGRIRAAMSVDASYVETHLRNAVMIDARSPARWRGEAEPIDREAGRIPGARNRFSNDNLTPEGVFKPAAQLKREFDAVLAGHPPGDSVNSCGSGVAACHNLLAMEVAGLPGGRLYAGSWSEWIADPSRPRERG